MQYEGVERQAVEVLLLALRSPLLAWLDSSLERPAVSRTNSSTATDPRAILDVALDNWETLRRKRRLPGKFKDALYNVRSLRDQWAHWQEISPERVAAGVISARFLLSVINDVEALEALEVALYDLDAKAVAEMTGIAAARQQVADLESLLAQTMAELDAATPNLAVIPPAGPSPDELNMQPMGSPSLPTATPADRVGVPLNLPAGELAKNGSSPTVDAESERQISLLAAKVEHLESERTQLLTSIDQRLKDIENRQVAPPTAPKTPEPQAASPPHAGGPPRTLPPPVRAATITPAPQNRRGNTRRKVGGLVAAAALWVALLLGAVSAFSGGAASRTSESRSDTEIAGQTAPSAATASTPASVTTEARLASTTTDGPLPTGTASVSAATAAIAPVPASVTTVPSTTVPVTPVATTSPPLIVRAPPAPYVAPYDDELRALFLSASDAEASRVAYLAARSASYDQLINSTAGQGYIDQASEEAWLSRDSQLEWELNQGLYPSRIAVVEAVTATQSETQELRRLLVDYYKIHLTLHESARFAAEGWANYYKFTGPDWPTVASESPGTPRWLIERRQTFCDSAAQLVSRGGTASTQEAIDAICVS